MDLKIFEIILNLHNDLHMISGNRILRQSENPEYEISVEFMKITIAENQIKNKLKLELQLATKNV